MSQLITDECITSFIKNHLGKTDISGIGDGTVTGALKTLNTELASAYNLVNQGHFTGNYDSITSDDGLPFGNSICWVNKTSSKGTDPFPDVNTNYFELITIYNIVIIQIAIVENSTEALAPHIAWRVCDSGTWSFWSVIYGTPNITPTIKFHNWIKNSDYSSISYKNGICICNIQIGIETGADKFTQLGFADLNVIAKKTAFGVLTDQNSGLSFDMHIFAGDNTLNLNVRGCELPNSCYFRGQIVFEVE